MKKNILKITLSSFLMLALFFTSCKKNETAIAADETEIKLVENIGADDAETDAVYNLVHDDVIGADDEVGMTGVGFLGRTSETGRIDSAGGFACLTVTRTRLNPPALFPIKITYDFGNGCRGANGQFRKGKMITVYTGRMSVPGSQANTTFENYHIDSFKIEGAYNVKNTSTLTVPQYQVTLRGGKITNVNTGNFKTRIADHTFTQVLGQGTPLFPLDDVLEIKGFASGTNNRNGASNSWSRTILNIEPIIKKYNCRWLVKGKVKIERTNKPDAILDYGDGRCDNLATVTVNGQVRNITLPF